MSGSTARSILVLNVGSSTLKFGVFPVAGGDDALLRGVLDHAGSSAGQLRTIDASGRSSSIPIRGAPGSAIGEVLRIAADQLTGHRIEAVGHRLVHGGSTMRAPVRVDAVVRKGLEALVPLAPEHLPAELRAIDEVSRYDAALTQVACFDTAFHASLPTVARLFGISRELSDSGVVRYGFHGLSYEYVTALLRERGELPPRLIIAHLGNGASLCAVRDGVSIDTSMGMTPTGGVVMSTRSGDLDPGVLLYLMRSRGLGRQQLEDATDRSGGLLGISALSGDVRELLAAAPDNPRAREAIDIFCYKVRKFIGAYAAALGGLDALVFVGGIGEHSAPIRGAICGELGFLGVELDAGLNNVSAPLISAATSRVRVRVEHTREDVMIARHVRALLAADARR
ncbi:MAG TPA: acetate/propionate family kinase [Gemmatimonadaceae bacterium]|nr:acetate/propionate family kinase [Gemmatimonadaceae bacterium]